MIAVSDDVTTGDVCWCMHDSTVDDTTTEVAAAVEEGGGGGLSFFFCGGKADFMKDSVDMVVW